MSGLISPESPEAQALIIKGLRERVDFLEMDRNRMKRVVDTAVEAAVRREWFQMVLPVVDKNITATGSYRQDEDRPDVAIAGKAMTKAEETHRKALAKYRDSLK